MAEGTSCVFPSSALKWHLVTFLPLSGCNCKFWWLYPQTQAKDINESLKEENKSLCSAEQRGSSTAGLSANTAAGGAIQYHDRWCCCCCWDRTPPAAPAPPNASSCASSPGCPRWTEPSAAPGASSSASAPAGLSAEEHTEKHLLLDSKQQQKQWSALHLPQLYSSWQERDWDVGLQEASPKNHNQPTAETPSAENSK